MAELYENTKIYDLFDSESKARAIQTHWRTLLDGTDIKTMLDVSIGTGSLTLPAAGLGIQLAGSDLSPEMLRACRKKAAAQNIRLPLYVCDFRNLTDVFSESFDCVASTGNSLPHVPNADLRHALSQMDALVRPGGYLYFDMRNWDKILRERRRFYLYDPVFQDDVRVNLIQVWDYVPDGSMVFNLLYTFERDGHIFDKQKFSERYYPIRRELLLAQLQAMGYRDVRLLPHPAQAGCDADEADWYCVLAKK